MLAFRFGRGEIYIYMYSGTVLERGEGTSECEDSAEVGYPLDAEYADRRKHFLKADLDLEYVT